MSIGNYVGIGGAVVVFGMTMLVLMKEYVAPWIARHLRLRPTPIHPDLSKPKVRGVLISFRARR